MNPKTSHKVIAAGGMAALIAIGTAVFFMRSPPSAPIARVEAPTAPVAEPPVAVPEALASLPAAPVPDANVPVAPTVAAVNDAPSHKASERAVVPMADAKPPRHREAASADSQVDASSHTVARSEPVATIAKPAVADTVVGADRSDTGPMTASMPALSPDSGASGSVVASDSQITSEVKSAIASEALARDASIAVTTTDGVVALSGSVPTQAAIDQVKDAAAKVKDVKRVDTSGLLLASL